MKKKHFFFLYLFIPGEFVFWISIWNLKNHNRYKIGSQSRRYRLSGSVETVQGGGSSLRANWGPLNKNKGPWK